MSPPVIAFEPLKGCKRVATRSVLRASFGHQPADAGDVFPQRSPNGANARHIHFGSRNLLSEGTKPLRLNHVLLPNQLLGEFLGLWREPGACGQRDRQPMLECILA
jgi:hypothetical protein